MNSTSLSSRAPGGFFYRLSPAARAARRQEDGFSVIEVMLAMAVFALVAAFLSQLLGAGFKGVLLGKRREVATQEANRLLEIARSLSYDAIGLVATDPTIPTDTENISDVGGVLSFRPDAVWEPLVWAPNSSNHPYNPHIGTVRRGSTDLTHHVYVTGVDSDGDGTIDLKRVTVRVGWETSGTPGPRNEVRAQTLVNPQSQVECVQPCDTAGGETPLTAQTFASGSSVRIDSALLGLTNPLNVTLPTSKGDSEFRLVSRTNCSTQSAALRATDLIDLPGYSVTVTADNDAATATPSDPPASTNSGVLTIPAGAVNDLLGGSIGSPVSCDAAVDPLPNEQGEASALSATLSAQDRVIALAGLLDWLLTLATVSTQPVTQDIANEMVGDQREAAATTSSAIGLAQVLKIPGVIGSGLVQVDGFSYGASVSASSGNPSAAPSVTTPSFTVRIFDNGNRLGSGCAGAVGTGITASRSGSYCVVTVNPSAIGFIGRQITLTHNFTQLIGLNLVNLVYTTTIDLLPAAKTPAAGEIGPNGERRWSAEYTPMTISASLRSDVLGADIINANVDLNVGTVTAKGCAGTACL